MLVFAVFCSALFAQQAIGGPSPARKPDVLYVPTPPAAVERMIELAEIKPGDTVYDLGCGDGRIVVEAAKRHGVRAIGVDIDPERVRESIENARATGVGHLVTIKEADIFTLDLGGADVVFLYLHPKLNAQLMPQLRKLKPGSRIVSFDFDMGDAKPVRFERGNFGDVIEHRIYKWVTPWEEDATPAWDLNTLSP